MFFSKALHVILVCVSVVQVDLGVFDLWSCPSLLSLFEPELEFFVFPPGGVALTGLIQNTRTNCSTTPAATVSKPPPPLCLRSPPVPPSAPQRTPVSMTTISHSHLHGLSFSPAQPHTPVSMATTLHAGVLGCGPAQQPPLPPLLASNPACCLTPWI